MQHMFAYDPRYLSLLRRIRAYCFAQLEQQQKHNVTMDIHGRPVNQRLEHMYDEIFSNVW